MKTMTTATKTTKTKNLTAAQARKITDAIKKNLDALPKFIHEAMTGKAYLALGYESVEAWAKTEFDLSRSRIYQISAWQSVEQKLRAEFDLDPTWTTSEEKVRNMNAERWNELTNSIKDAITADMDAETRGDKVRSCISTNFGEIQKKKAAEVAAAKAAEAMVSPASTEGDEKTPDAPAVKVEVRITAVPQDYKVLLRKAVDTGSVLTTLSEDEDKEITLAKLNDAKRVLDDLLAYYTTAENITA
jgi:hypothetical protein